MNCLTDLSLARRHLPPKNCTIVSETILLGGNRSERTFRTPQKGDTVDQVVAKLRKADVELGKGKKVPEVCKLLEVTEQTYYRWRQKYGGMKPEMAKQLKALEKENARLKKMVAEQALDMEILKEAAKGNW